MIARYLARLRKWVETLPDRHERRQLNADIARSIVALKGNKFGAVIDKLEGLCGQHVPEALFSDARVDEMLIQLEDIFLAKFAPSSRDVKRHWFSLDWSYKGEVGTQFPMPIPIYGLEFTMGFYFANTPIYLSLITELNLSGLDLKGKHLKFFN
jgi:hypothetical protein